MSSVARETNLPPNYFEAIARDEGGSVAPNAPASVRLQTAFLLNAREQLRAGEAMPEGLIRNVAEFPYPMILDADQCYSYQDIFDDPMMRQKTQAQLAKSIAHHVQKEIQAVPSQIRQDLQHIYGRRPKQSEVTTRLKQYEQTHEAPRIYQLVSNPRIAPLPGQSAYLLPEDVEALGRIPSQAKLEGRYVHLGEAICIFAAAYVVGVVAGSAALGASLLLPVGLLVGCVLLLCAASSGQAGTLPLHKSLPLAVAALAAVAMCPLGAASALLLNGEYGLLPPFFSLALLNVLITASELRFLEKSLMGRVHALWAG